MRNITLRIRRIFASTIYDASGAFDESKFRVFNRIAGNQFSEADVAKQLGNAKMMLRGMDDLKQTLRTTMIEAIQTFEEIERID